MMVMRSRRVGRTRVALQADIVTLCAQRGGMRLVAIAAGDAGRKHAALLERAVIVDLVTHLSVREIMIVRERCDEVRVRERAARDPRLGQSRAPRVTEPARLHFLAQDRRGNTPLRFAGARIRQPGDVGAFIE
jgi:hypothetical protein